MRVRAAWAGAILVGLLSGPAFARPVNAPPTMAEAVSQPLRDLSIIRRQVPPVLLRAVAGPYDAPAPTSCTQIAADIAELDEALGPDFDSVEGVRRTSLVRGLAIDGVRSVIGLPYRGLIRVITGARRRDDALQLAIMAGISRRGFLKGMSRGMACEAGDTLPAVPALVQVQTATLAPPPPIMPTAADTGTPVNAAAEVTLTANE